MERDLALAMLIAKERSGELPTLRTMVRKLAAPFYWYDQTSEQAERIVNNGTACFVNTGKREIMITCNHVYSAWLAQRERNANLVCQVGGAIIEPSNHLIDCDEELDLATFEIGADPLSLSRSALCWNFLVYRGRPA